ncbi:Adenylate and Guanylate cyclase catalytic domain-containing protein [Stigmatella erecta]|uniref:Adenylate and Guanylate cyclase catalytic domain-containing protein n=1 Tax=Stigmatella erecta TaxID=83460 RepID=A0A1I0GPP8_9BACT|nr:Adenylate and Guanylate cyclase catalytic domain-containing protein [Stigmatella erecta]
MRQDSMESDESGELDDAFLRQVAHVPVPLRLPVRGEFLGGQEGRRFEILEQLGGGSMGLVFRARDHELQRVVALKFLHPREEVPEAPLRALLRQEAKAIAQLDHENIVRIFDVAEWTGESWESKVPFLIMECLSGEPLSALMSREPLPLRRCIGILREVAAGLAHAHAHHIVHRDLKPGNVFITQTGQVKLLDFGLAYLTAAVFPSAPHLPAAGTPAYMAPEQWRGQEQDARADIWAAGIMFFEMLTGELPCPEPSLAGLREWALSEKPVPSIRERRPELPEEVDHLLAAMLAKAPQQRLASAARFEERLRHIEAGVTPWNVELASLGPQRRQVTLVACWLADLSGLAEHLDSEDFGELEGAFHQASSEVLLQHGGSITTCLGDEVLACFGYPQAREDDPEKAARAALHLAMHLGTAIQQKLPYLPRRKLTVKVGLHTDTVVLDNLPPGPQGRAAALQGEAPKVAFWLARQAAPDTVCLSHTAWLLVKAAFRMEPMGVRSFQGLSGEVKGALYRLAEEKRTTSRFEQAHETGGLTPLVGREEELRRLLESWAQARQGEGAFVLVQGEAGIGKSRLLRELRERIHLEECSRLHVQCWAQFSNSALRPIIELLLAMLKLHPDGNPQSSLRKLRGRMGAVGLPAEHVRMLAAFLSLPADEPPPHLRLTPERQKEKTFEALVTLLLRMAEDRPVFAVVEDLHWADPSTLELLGALLNHIGTARICVFLTTRPDFKPQWGTNSRVHPVLLERLTPRLTAELIRHSASGKLLPAETVEQLVAKTDGVPLFAEEMTRMVVEQAPAGTATGNPSTIPVTLSGLLLARLDMLPRQQKTLAQLCAVVGRGFSHALLTTLSGRSQDHLQQDLTGLLQAGLLQQDEGAKEARYHFRHALIHDAAYHSLLRRTRREYHRRIAQALALQAPELAEMQPELLAHHYTEAGASESAIQLWAKAGEQASLRSANVEAIRHLSQALRLLGTLPETPARSEQELQLQVALGMPLMQMHSLRSREVEKTYSRVMELLPLVEDSLSRLHVSTWGAYAYTFARAKFHVAQELAELTVRQGERQNSRELLALGHRMIATNHFTWGHMSTALEHVEHALESSNFDLSQHRALAVKEWVNPRVAALAYGSVVLSAVGRDALARRYGEEAVALAGKIGHPHTLAFGLTYVALGCQLRGEPECAQRWVEQCMAVSSEHNFRLWLSWSVFIKSWLLAEQGRVQEGLALLQANLARWRQAGLRAGMPLFLGMLAEFHLKLGQFQEGLTVVTHALGWAETLGERSYEVELYRLEGELHRALGHESLATNSFLKARRVAQRQGSAGFGKRVEESLDRQLHEQGRDRTSANPR